MFPILIKKIQKKAPKPKSEEQTAEKNPKISTGFFIKQTTKNTVTPLRSFSYVNSCVN